MSPFNLTNIAASAVEKLHLSKKRNKKVSSLTISAPIEGSFEHHESHIPAVAAPPDYRVNLDHADPIMPRRYSDLVQFAEHLSRQLIGTRYALASEREVRWNSDRQNTMMQRQVQRADAVVVNNKVLREEIVELKKQIVEEKRIADVLRRLGGDTRNKLKNEVVQLTMEKAYLEGELQEARSGVDERYAALESLALTMLETLG